MNLTVLILNLFKKKSILFICSISLLFFDLDSQDFVENLTRKIKGRPAQGNSFSFNGGNDKFWEDVFQIDTVLVYGGGVLFDLASGKSDSDSSETTPAGSLGINFFSDRLSGNIFYSYNGRKTINVKTLDNFSLALLNPVREGQSFNFSLLYQISDKLALYSGIQVNDNLWQINDSTTIDASPNLIRIGFKYTPFDFSKIRPKNNIEIILFPHFIHRSIGGDFNNETQVIDGNAINPRGYNGIALRTSLKVNSVELFVNFINQFKIDDLELKEFEGSQVSFGINVTGKFLQL